MRYGAWGVVLAAWLLLTPPAHAALNAVKLLDGAIATGTGEEHGPNTADRTFQASGTTSAGAGSAVVTIQFSNDKVNWINGTTITLTLGTTSTTDGFVSDAPWRYVRANLTTITGTNAAVTVWMGTGRQ
jgi:hypothetical protein